MKNKEAKVDKFLSKHLNEDNPVFNVSLLNVNNTYILFGKYCIVQEKDWYVLTSEHTDIKKIFSTIKTAITWGVYREKRLFTECRDIESIDYKLSSLEIDICQKNKVLNNIKDEANKLIYTTKIDEDHRKKKMLLKQLNRYISKSKEWQDKSFNAAKSSNKR